MEVGIFNKQNLAYKENVKNKEMGNMSTQMKSNPKVIITKDINGFLNLKPYYISTLIFSKE